jgi:hypothetical protein
MNRRVTITPMHNQIWLSRANHIKWESSLMDEKEYYRINRAYYD